MTNLENNNEEVIIEAKTAPKKNHSVNTTGSGLIFCIENLPFTLAIIAIMLRLVGQFIAVCGSFGGYKAFVCIAILTLLGSFVLTMINMGKAKTMKLNWLHSLLALATLACLI